MRKYFYDDIDENDELSDEDVYLDAETDGYGSDGRIILDDPMFSYEDEDTNEIEDDDLEEETENNDKTYYGFIGRNLISILRNELKSPEYDRGSLDFKWNDNKYEGVPMVEINPNKFVFKILPDGILKSFLLSEIEILD